MYSTLWKQRDDARHGVDKATKVLATRAQLQQELIQLYDYKHQMHQSDQEIFFPDVQTHLKESITSIRNWLSCYKPLILHSKRRVIHITQTSHKAITTYFKSIPKIRRRRIKRKQMFKKKQTKK